MTELLTDFMAALALTTNMLERSSLPAQHEAATEIRKSSRRLIDELTHFQAENERLKKSLPTSVDGETILNGMTVYFIVGTYVDERKVISCANHAVYTFEPQRLVGPGQSCRPESYIYAHRENALKALNNE